MMAPMTAAMPSPPFDHLISVASSEVMAARRSAGLTIGPGLVGSLPFRRRPQGRPGRPGGRGRSGGTGERAGECAGQTLAQRRGFAAIVEKGLHLPARVPGPPVVPKSPGYPRSFGGCAKAPPSGGAPL